MPLISAIIIFLNEERFLREAIASVLSQTYDNWELLLIDDGSTDHSAQIAREYVEQFPEKIRYLTHENGQNRGMSASRNLGIAEAKGDYIAYLDGDDIWIPAKLSQQMALLAEQPEAAMVYGPLKDWYSWSGHAEDRQKDGLYGVGKDGTHPYSDRLVQPPHLLRLFLANEDFIPSGGLMRRAAVQSLGGYEESFKTGYSDYSLFVKMGLYCPVFVSSDCTYHYRQHPQSCTAISLSKGEDIAESFAYLKWTQQYLTDQGVTDRQIWRSLNQSLWPYRHPYLHQRLTACQLAIHQVEEVGIVVGRRLLPAALRDWLWRTFKDPPKRSL